MQDQVTAKLIYASNMSDATLAEQSDLAAEFATASQAADKVVYSSTLAAHHAPRTLGWSTTSTPARYTT